MLCLLSESHWHIIKMSQAMLCLLPESHWHINKMSQFNALSLVRVTLAHYQHVTGQCSVPWQSQIGTLPRCHRSMLSLLAESHWHIIKMSQGNALSLGKVTLSHYQMSQANALSLGKVTLSHRQMSRSIAPSLARVTVAHSQLAHSLCPVSCQSHIGTLSKCHSPMLCLFPESHWHIIKMSQANAWSFCAVSCQSHIGTFSSSSQLMLCLLAESHWHIEAWNLMATNVSARTCIALIRLV